MRVVEVLQYVECFHYSASFLPCQVYMFFQPAPKDFLQSYSNLEQFVEQLPRPAPRIRSSTQPCHDKHSTLALLIMCITWGRVGCKTPDHFFYTECRILMQLVFSFKDISFSMEKNVSLDSLGSSKAEMPVLKPLQLCN